MKRLTAILMALALLMSAVGACAEEEALTFEQLAGMEWSFSSGAGGWSTDMHIAEDGSFSGTYHDSEMGETGEGYPNGSFYYCNFNGQLSIAGQADDGAWKLHVDSLSMESEPNQESIEDDIRYVTAEVYGLSEGDELLLYAPGTPADALSEEMQMWAHMPWQDDPTALESWFLADESYDSGFVGYVYEEGDLEDAEIANPWVDMAEDELWQTAGVNLNLPEGAEATAFRWLPDQNLAEMDFTMDGDEYCARVKPAALEAGELENISDIYYEWEHEEEISVAHCPGTLGLAQTGSEDFVELCMWYDLVPGLMYSLSVNTTDPDGLDLVAVAEVVYSPMQGEA